MGWNPTIINPTIAGATRRKTDILDSRLPALHDQLNIWRECYIPSEDVKILRAMISQRDRYIHDATAAGNRIHNILTRFGFTIDRNGSVVRDHEIRSIVENQISDYPDSIQGLCPIPIPMEIRLILREEYEKFDRYTAQTAQYKTYLRESLFYGMRNRYRHSPG